MRTPKERKVSPVETAEVEQELRGELVKLKTSVIAPIKDQDSYDHAVQILGEIKTFRKRWADYWTPKKDSAHKTWKMLCDAFNEGDKPAETHEAQIKRALLVFDDEQRRLQEERQREEQRKAEEAAEALRVQQSVEAEVAGATDEEIEELMSAPVLAVAPPVHPTYQKASGISRRDNWTVQVVDLKALLKALAAGKLKLSKEDSLELAEFLQSLLKPRAVSDHETMDIPGCKAVNIPIIASRGGR
jgi:hypothetical protein